MKKTCIALSILLIICVLNNPLTAQIRIFMIGDSTMANKPLTKEVTDSITGEKFDEPFPEKGWGQLLPTFFNDKVKIENYAKNGRSSKSFIREGLWDKVITNIQKGDYLIIQFGHNDSSKDKGDRYTTPEEYEKNFTMFVQEAKKKGAKPIICTSVVRRKFKNNVFEDSHGEYLDLARKVAKDEKIPMIDMYEKSKKLVTGLGKDGSVVLFLHLQPGENRNFPQGKTDNTHFNERGATEMAALFVEGLKEQKLKDLVNELKK